MKIGIYKAKEKNMSGEFTGQIDYGETQIQVFASKKKELNRILTEIKKIIKPTTANV